MKSSTEFSRKSTLTKRDKWQQFGVILFMLVCTSCILEASSYGSHTPITTIKLNPAKTKEFDQFYLEIENSLKKEEMEKKIGLDSTNHTIIMYPLTNDHYLFTSFSERIVHFALQSRNNQNINTIEVQYYCD